ncbi:MAG TPA: aldo/keto reductase [Thermoanaerobaculia bacterium]|nr:aldo/keto reductase [Thermoanaerobaculia bacterium]
MTNINRRDAVRLIGFAAFGFTTPFSPAAAGEKALLMLTRKIPSSNESLPVIGLGTWQTFDAGPSAAARQPLEAVLREFVARGGSVLDSSPMYGRSEEVAGDLAAKLGVHPKLFVATKVWTTGKRAGIAQMEDSMRKLRVKRVDLMQVHNLVDVMTHLDTLAAWKREGRVRYTGVTHYTAGSHDDVARVIQAGPVDFIQINYSVGEREAERRLLPLAAERGVAVIANRPFASGRLFRRLRDKPLPPWAAEIDCTSWAQVLLKFVVSHPSITCAIPATSKVEHLTENMGAGGGKMPDEGLRRRIVAAVEN